MDVDYSIWTQTRAGQFISPIGGHVSSGETEEDALKRESMEEVGLEVKRFKLAGRKIFNRFILGRQENHYFVVFEIFTDDKPILGDEVKDFQYFTKSKIKDKMRTKPEIFGDAFHFVYKNIYKEFKLQ